MSLPPAVCVLVSHERRLLFIERAKGRFAEGYWTPVTGRPLPGEPLPKAAEREVLEETGLRVVAGRELGRTGTDAPGGGSAGFELVWIAASLAPGTDPRTLTLQEEEVSRAVWVSREDALALEPMFPTTRRFLESLPDDR